MAALYTPGATYTFYFFIKCADYQRVVVCSALVQGYTINHRNGIQYEPRTNIVDPFYVLSSVISDFVLNRSLQFFPIFSGVEKSQAFQKSLYQTRRNVGLKRD